MQALIRPLIYTTVILSFIAAGVTSARAQDYITLSAGGYNIGDVNEEGQAMAGIEYRGEPIWYNLLPTIGASADLDGGLYGYVGLNYDIEMGQNWILIPNFAAGAYEEGSSKDLGHTIQFRSGIELDYVFPNQSRIGITLNHMSNAGIGDSNPGVENLLMTYSHPLQ